MEKIIKQNLILILIIFFAFVFYTFRLSQTFVMASDTARDLVRVMEIWQNKEFTVIGPPVNTINNKPLEVYFGSMYYYFGLIGLYFSNFNPIGSVYINIFITLLSIPFFYLLSKKILKEKPIALITTFVYALSPVTISFVRSYWNPNLIIPLSVFVWYFLLCKKNTAGLITAGILSGVVFNLHYVGFVPIAFYLFLQLINKKWKEVFILSVGLLISLSPLIAFELKHNFFLFKAFIANSGGSETFSGRTINPFLSLDTLFYIFGLGPTDFYLQSQINLGFNIRVIIDTIIGIPFIYFLLKNLKYFDKQIVASIIFGLLLTWYLETFHIIHIRYAFSIYPLLIISYVYFSNSINKYLLYLLIIPMLILSYKIITYKLDPTHDYYPISTVEDISNSIVADNPSGKYSITEDILGDARSLSFRYFLLRDAKVKPQPVEKYTDVATLYVVSPSIEKINYDNRWEFISSGPKEIAWVKDFGELKLFKFVK